MCTYVCVGGVWGCGVWCVCGVWYVGGRGLGGAEVQGLMGGMLH